ncbi:M20/M25/M40 family metallo-hydrolase [Pedobacter duraquae]|uniref:Peptidase M28-like protein n=1 Tax=Pedobacter duraquae TaxID=425511 RepID=A0A4R6IHG2_9SPHI|nr:M20/M25/M40 family metallo-hydrolase [Pedobacter duraquae]TDO21368.1 peptidase M28-like protein [Pedobacter duraquae]
MMKRLPFALLAFCLANNVQAQDIDKIITKPYVDGLIKTLSADDMQGRGSFTPGIDKAATFIERQFKEIGLKPLAGAKGFRQTFPVFRMKPQSVTVKLNNQDIAPENILVAGSSAAETKFDLTNGDGFIRLNPGQSLQQQLRTLSRTKKRQIVLVDQKFTEDFRKLKAAPSRGSIVDETTLKDPKGPALVLVLTADTVASGFNVAIKNSAEELSLFNVAGMIPGKSKAKEIVVFSGHYDHLGIVKPTDQDSIANGADDDASGTTAMIALAKYYKKLKNNERTLIFVAFTAEEIGGFGAKHFSRGLNPDDVTAMFNIEMIGKDSKFGKNTAFITGYEKSDFGAILQKNLAGTQFTFHPDPYPAQRLFYRSDNATLAALGVPAHTISTDMIDIDKLYHTVNDEYESLDTDNILATIKGIAKAAITIVKGTDTPTRIPKLVE